MKIVQIEDCYIEMLKKEFPSIMDSKRFHRSHSRKYLGILFLLAVSIIMPLSHRQKRMIIMPTALLRKAPSHQFD